MNKKVFTLRFKLIAKLSRIVRCIRWYKLYWGGYINISKRCIIEHGVELDKINPKGIYIGENTLVASNTTILSHDHVRKRLDGSYWYADTRIGRNCFIGVRSLILPGVHIGDECCIGAGSVVTKDIPSHSMVVGVPAKIIKTDIRMDEHARLI